MLGSKRSKFVTTLLMKSFFRKVVFFLLLLLLKARDLYEGTREFTPVFKIWMNTNYLPIIGDRTIFSSDRVKVISFDRHFEYEEQDRHLKQKLTTDEAKSGILNWMIEGLQNYRKKETLPPQCIVQASAEYAQMQDKIGCFIGECLEELNNFNMKMSDAYSVYSEWCKESGYGTDSKRSFKQDLILRGLFKEKAKIDGMTITNVLTGYHFNTEGKRLLDKVERY